MRRRTLIPSRPLRRVAALGVVGVFMAACGSSHSATSTTAGSQPSVTVAPTTVAPTTVAPTTAAPTTTLPAGIDGSQSDELPSPPLPTTPPSLPSPNTPASRRLYVTAVFNDAQRMWAQLFQQAGLTYRPARLVLFTAKVSTACGAASSDSGPFYCSGDQTVYLDTTFFDDLQARFGVTGDFSQAYVVAHEMGHHIQYLLGVTGRVAAADQVNPSIKNALSIRVELQADCLAGVWAHSTYQRNLLEPGDLEEALAAAASVGDDFLQQATTGSVNPESWTHGTSAQRDQWLTTGFNTGETSACDTFSATP